MKRAIKLEIFHNLLAYLASEKIGYVILGNVSTYSTVIPSDIDIAISKGDFNKVDSIVNKFCELYSYKPCNCLEHEVTAKYYVIAVIDEVDMVVDYIALDFCSDYYRNNRLLITSEQLLTRFRKAKTGTIEFNVCNYSIAFLYYFIKRVEKKSFLPAHIKHLSNLWEIDKKGILDLLGRVFDKAETEAISTILDNFPSRLADNSLIIQLQNTLFNKYRPTMSDRLRNSYRIFRRITEPSGLVIAFLGCDGSGKSTLINHISSKQKSCQPFRSSCYFHLFPTLKNGNKEVVSQPHLLKERSILLSNIKVLYVLFKYLTNHLTIVYPRLVQSKLVIYDRYYHDQYVDPKRYRHGGSLIFAKLVGLLIPKPNLFFFIDAPTEDIYTRKQEVPFAEIERQRAEYISLSATLRNSRLILNKDDPALSGFEIEKIIVKELNKRYRQRGR